MNVDYIVTDYMKLHTDIPVLAIPKGDATSQCVAAASILAKVTRDHYMEELDKQYPEYLLRNIKVILPKLIWKCWCLTVL